MRELTILFSLEYSYKLYRLSPMDGDAIHGNTQVLNQAGASISTIGAISVVVSCSGSTAEGNVIVSREGQEACEDCDARDVVEPRLLIMYE